MITIRIVVVLSWILALVGAEVTPVLAAGGQTGNLQGTVLVAQAKVPLEGAAVTVAAPSGTYTARTNTRGFFSILGLNVDTYTVSIEAPGYESLALPGVTITGDQTNDLGPLSLSKKLKTIASTTTRSQTGAFQPGQTTDSYTVSGSRVTQSTGKTDTTNENNIVLSVPGVTLTDGGAPTIRGGAPTEVGYQLDGINFAEPFDGGNGSYNRVNGLGSIQVVEGAGDATQGNVGSGVINVIPRRGTSPGFADFDTEMGGPNFSHQLAFDYGTASSNGSVSNYFSYVGDRFVPYYGYHTQDLQEYGNTFGIGYQVENQLLDNFVVKFGSGRRQSLQVLYSNQDIQAFGDAGGVVTNPNVPGYLSYYPTNPFDGNEEIVPILAEFYGPAAAAAYPSLVALNPNTPANPNSPVTQSEEHTAGNTRFLKLEYDNAIDSNTYLALKYFNWAQVSDLSENYSVLPGNLASYAVEGGSRSGVILDLSRQIGSHLTLQLDGSYQDIDPVFDSFVPAVTFFGPGFIGPVTAQPNYADFLPGGYLSTYFPGGAPRIPNWGDDNHGSFFQEYGAGLRLQYSATDRLKFDVGFRDEQEYKHWINPYAASASNPFDLNPSAFTPATNDPHVSQPRGSVSYTIDNNDSVRFGYGRSAIFPDGFTSGTPFTTAGLQPFVNIPAKPGAACGLANFGGTFPCKTYAQELYWEGDILNAPDLGEPYPAIYSNYDLTFQHRFANGFGMHVTPFYKLGTSLPDASLINVLPGGIDLFQTTSQSFNRTTGVEFELTTPEHPFGFAGFASATYQNVLQSAPPLTADEDTIPQLPPATLALGDVYRAGYVSPVNLRIGGTYNFHNGLSITPVLQYDIGFPYNIGDVIAAEIAPGVYANVPQVNFGPGLSTIAGYQNQTGSNVSTNYYDPAFPGTTSHPLIAATRGTPASASNGGVLWNPNLEANLTVQYKRNRSVVGLAITNLFGNAYNGSIPLINPYYQPVANGLSGPLTNANPLQSTYGSYRGAGNIPHDTCAFTNCAYLLTSGAPASSEQGVYPTLSPLQPTTFTLYYQYKL